MKKEVKDLLKKATDSVLLSIEHFNRPWDRGRNEAVLIFLDRSFELLFKSIIVHKGGKIREPRAKETIGFDTCVRRCLSDVTVKCITKEEALTIQIVNSLRDAAQHYIVDLSEQQLYVYTQSALTLFDRLLHIEFNSSLTTFLPARVLPISSSPPANFSLLMNVEFADIKKLVKPGSRKKFQAKSKLRSFAIIEASLSGSRSQPSENELEKLIQRIVEGENWHQIFPGVKRLTLSTETGGINIALKITKTKGEPVRLVPEGTPGATIIAVKRVDELGYYSIRTNVLAEKLGLTPYKTLAVVKYLNLQADSEYFKEFKIGTYRVKMYSSKALNVIKQKLPSLNLTKVCELYKRSIN